MPRTNELAELKHTEETICGELDVDGVVDDKGMRFIGKAKKQPDGTWVCLANVGGALCQVEVRITITVSEV